MLITLETSCSTYDAVEITHVVVSLDAERIARIRQLAAAVKSLGVLSITEFDYSLGWYGGDPDAEEGELKRVDIPEMVVYDDSVHWQCTEKFCDDVIATESIKIKELS